MSFTFVFKVTPYCHGGSRDACTLRSYYREEWCSVSGCKDDVTAGHHIPEVSNLPVMKRKAAQIQMFEVSEFLESCQYTDSVGLLICVILITEVQCIQTGKFEKRRDIGYFISRDIDGLETRDICQFRDVCDFVPFYPESRELFEFGHFTDVGDRVVNHIQSIFNAADIAEILKRCYVRCSEFVECVSYRDINDCTVSIQDTISYE